jgi:hypothetical protein
MKKAGVCVECGSVRTVIVSEYYYLDENCEPTDEVEGCQCECIECLAFWDEQ